MSSKLGAPKGKPHNYPANRKSSPRAGKGTNTSVSNIPADAIRNAVSASLYWSKMSPVKTDDECAERLNFFFEKIIELGHYPTIEKLALALGVAVNTVSAWEHGSLGLTRMGMVKKAKQMIADLDAQLAAQQKISPVVYIFRAKNYYGLQDQVKVISEAPTEQRNLTDEDIRSMIKHEDPEEKI